MSNTENSWVEQMKAVGGILITLIFTLAIVGLYWAYGPSLDMPGFLQNVVLMLIGWLISVSSYNSGVTTAAVAIAKSQKPVIVQSATPVVNNVISDEKNDKQ